MKDKKLMAMIAGTAAAAGVVATIAGIRSAKNLKSCCEDDSLKNDSEISIEEYSEESKEKINIINNKIEELNQKQLELEAELEAKRDEILKLKEEVILEEEKLRQSIEEAKGAQLEEAADLSEEVESDEVVEEKEATVE
ncbi:hypothetical protein HH195_01175 [Sarcina sp. JB2]|uniref:Uncharacterized protein n=1 Tax=Candidatus Sarcina troglodytae TaxID=2726954 RepID=A0ACD1BB00_9CLOT|nr:hypothetical protein [Sarcina sp. JB2]QPJ84601.1 hypothetical protein HH195_01175 [Sarcina sp. JB2]